MPRKPELLTKSRFLAGLQCLKRLWWEVHEGPPEGETDLALENRLAWGRRVTERARESFGPGVLVEREGLAPEAAVEATARALAAGATRVYEAAFEAEGVHVAVDVLERVPGGWRLVEVKSATRVKDEHVADAAIQAWVVRRSGLRIKAVEVAHLDARARTPGLDGLFARVDVTRRVAAFTRRIRARLAAQRETLAGPVPTVEVGPHCRSPHDCPFLERCAVDLPEHDVGTLYYAGQPLLERLRAAGVATVDAIPDDVELSPPQDRQRRAVRSGALVVDAGLGDVLAGFRGPVAFLDFETVSPAVPRWDGCGPWTHVPVQFACEVRGTRGTEVHEHLAEPEADPRAALAQRLLEATQGARTVFAYYAKFEVACIEHLAGAVPAHAAPLRALARRMADLLPVVRNHVYHPAFHGRFGLKDVLPALLPHLAYDDLAVQEGGSASALLEGFLLFGTPAAPEERTRLRANLLAYCRRDVVGLGALYDWLVARGSA